MRNLAILVVSLLLAAPAALAQTSHGSGHGQTGQSSHTAGDHGAMAGVHAEAKINSIKGDTVNLSHGPIPEIGWPAMTMDLKVLEGAQISDVAAGDSAMIMLEKGPDGLYGIRSLLPAN